MMSFQERRYTCMGDINKSIAVSILKSMAIKEVFVDRAGYITGGNAWGESDIFLFYSFMMTSVFSVGNNYFALPFEILIE